MRHWPVVCCMLLACGSLLPGCKTPSSARNASTGTTSTSHASSDGRDFKLRTQATGPEEAAATPEGDIVLVQQLEPSGSLSDSLASLEWIATSNNPRLQRLQRETDAAWARTRYQDKLPDPTVGANIFAAPIETAAGSQRANLSLTQMIPWLDRLDAQAQQACFEAMVMQQMYAAEKLRVIGDVRASYYRLYVLQKQVQTIEANQALLKGLIEVINARLANSQATQGDVLLGTLEYSRLQEQLVTLRQQIRTTQAEINRLTNRPSETPIDLRETIPVGRADWSIETLRSIAWERQPAILAAHLRTNATRWGMEVADLQRRPNFSLGASWYLIEGNRPPSTIVDVGQDAWSVGATMSIPLWHEKYDAMRDEATWKHFASRAEVQELERQFDSQLLSLLAQARSAEETAKLYEETIIPQAEQTLRADQSSLTNGTVEFDRVIEDFRNLLTLEFGYHRAVGELATSLARIQQAVGIDLVSDSKDWLRAPPPIAMLPSEESSDSSSPDPEGSQ